MEEIERCCISVRMKAYAYLNVSNPWIAWLAYRGEMVAAPHINPQAISVWNAAYLIDAGNSGARSRVYRKELELERFRVAYRPDSVSRLTGLYFFPTLSDANKAEKWGGGFKLENLTEVEITSTLRASRYDSEWITLDFSSPGRQWISSYFSGVRRSADAIWELLVEGRALILGTELRKRAYQTVAATWPRSLGLLELSRVAVELGSDLGVITPIATANGSRLRIELRLNFQDATNEQFLRKFSNYDGPKNTKDLNSSSELVFPDLSHLTTEILV